MKRLLFVITILAWMVSPTFATIAHVKTCATSQAAGTTISNTCSITAGDMVVVTLMFNSSTAGVGTVTQSAGDTITFGGGRPNVNNGGTWQEQGTNYSVAGGSTTFTFSWSGSTTSLVFVTEISGFTNPAFDVTSSTNLTTNTTHDSGTTATLAQASELAIATYDFNGSGSTNFTSATNGFTVPTNGNQLGAVSGERGILLILVTSATTGINTVITTDNAIATGLIGTYKGAASATTHDSLMGFMR